MGPSDLRRRKNKYSGDYGSPGGIWTMDAAAEVARWKSFSWEKWGLFDSRAEADQTVNVVPHGDIVEVF